jgi:hypothetical protein
MLSRVTSTMVTYPAHALRVVRFRNDIDRLTIDAWGDRSPDRDPPHRSGEHTERRAKATTRPSPRGRRRPHALAHER